MELSTGRDTKPDPRRARKALFPLAIAFVVVGAGLALFDGISSTSSVVRRGMLPGAPIYGFRSLSFTRWAAISLVLAGAGAALAYLIAARDDIHTRPLVFGASAFCLAFAASVAIIGGDPDRFVDPLLRVRRLGDYIADVPLVRHLGVRGFMSAYPHLYGTLRSIHSTTHPPGPVVFLYYLSKLWPHSLVPQALVMATISSLVLVPTFFLARAIAGHRAAVLAVVLLAVAPAPALFTFLSMDAVFATLLATAAALLVWGLGPAGRARAALAGGFVLGLTSVMTYAVTFVAAFAVIWCWTVARPWRQTARLLGWALAGGMLAVGLLWIAAGFNLLASYRAALQHIPAVPLRSYPYWIFGNPAVWLTFAGVPIAALGLLELIQRRPSYLIALFIPLLIADLARGVFPGETERIGQFAYPFLAIAAGAALVRYESRSGRVQPRIVAACVLFAALQAIALQALYYTYW